MPPVFGILPRLKGRSSAVNKKPFPNLTRQSRAISSNPSMEVFNSLVEMPAPWRRLNELYLEFLTIRRLRSIYITYLFSIAKGAQ